MIHVNTAPHGYFVTDVTESDHGKYAAGRCIPVIGFIYDDQQADDQEPVALSWLGRENAYPHRHDMEGIDLVHRGALSLPGPCLKSSTG